MRLKTSPDTSGSKKQSSNRRGTQQLFYTEAFKQKIVNEVLSGKLNNFTWPTHISIKWRHGKESDESGKGGKQKRLGILDECASCSSYKAGRNRLSP